MSDGGHKTASGIAVGRQAVVASVHLDIEHRDSHHRRGEPAEHELYGPISVRFGYAVSREICFVQAGTVGFE